MTERRETKKTVIGKTIKHVNGYITIKAFKGSNGTVNEFIAECSVCSSDKDLWPYGSLIYDMININRKDVLCGCGRKTFQHLWQLELLIKRLLIGGDLEFKGWEGGHYKDHHSKAVLKSFAGEEWRVNVGNLRKQNTPIFSKGYKENLKIQNNIKSLENNELLPKHYRYFYDKSQKKYLVSCNVCNSNIKFKSLGDKLYPSRLDSLKIGRKPCRCSETYKYSYDERMVQIKDQIKERGLTKVRIPKDLNSRSRIVWVCEKGHIQDSKLNDFVKGCGCFECNKLSGGWYGYYPDRTKDKDNLYLIKFKRGDEVFYKIGRSFNIKERMRKMTKDYEMELMSSIQSNHQNIYNTEQSLHQKLNKFQHYVEFYFKGCVGECFTPEILNHQEVISAFNLKDNL